jgi:DNA helicase IV
MLYEQLDAYRNELLARLSDVRLSSAQGTHQWRSERDALARQYERRLNTLVIGDQPLYFGRLDLDDGARLHIGRVGIDRDTGEHASETPLLIDWRAPIASRFYSATTGSPQGVQRRRHLLTQAREVVAIDDEVFSTEPLSEAEEQSLHGDAALLASITRGRGAQMRDIVATIQREQDEIIRSDLRGILVVQGGPGTGKTAVALHRAAYLLYTHRQQLALNGVLIVGPNPVFMRYVEQVLPSLGETGAVLATIQSLLPGIRATEHDRPEVARIKGDQRMAEVIKAAIADRQRLPKETVRFAFERASLVLDRQLCARARSIGRRSRAGHNGARTQVENFLLDNLVEQVSREFLRIGNPALQGERLHEVRSDLRRSSDFRHLMERIWPVLSAEQLLNDLFGSAALLRSAAAKVPGLELELLHRPRVALGEKISWTIEDVPLLDEAAELLGVAHNAAQARRERAQKARTERERDYARQVIESLELPMSISIEQFARRFEEDSGETIAERALKDRSWRYGHVIVDEAQDLSPMAWRMIFRRNPNRSMTVVGDLAQQGTPWETPSWGSVFEDAAKDAWRVVDLTINYRNPSEITEVANQVLARIAVDLEPPRSIRSTGERPVATRATNGQLVAHTVEESRRAFSELDDGRLAIIAPVFAHDELRRELGAVLAELHEPEGRVVILDVQNAKGLEFDIVILVEPDAIYRASGRGANDLYVALTRATMRLVVVHDADLPLGIAEHFATGADSLDYANERA